MLALIVKLILRAFYSQTELTYPKALLSFLLKKKKKLNCARKLSGKKMLKLTRAFNGNNLLLQSFLYSLSVLSDVLICHILRLYEKNTVYGVNLVYGFYTAHLSNKYYLICIRQWLLVATFCLLNWPGVISSLTRGWTDFKSNWLELRLSYSDQLLEPM